MTSEKNLVCLFLSINSCTACDSPHVKLTSAGRVFSVEEVSMDSILHFVHHFKVNVSI